MQEILDVNSDFEGPDHGPNINLGTVEGSQGPQSCMLGQGGLQQMEPCGELPDPSSWFLASRSIRGKLCRHGAQCCAPEQAEGTQPVATQKPTPSIGSLFERPPGLIRFLSRPAWLLGLFGPCLVSLYQVWLSWACRVEFRLVG